MASDFQAAVMPYSQPVLAGFMQGLYPSKQSNSLLSRGIAGEIIFYIYFLHFKERNAGLQLLKKRANLLMHALCFTEVVWLNRSFRPTLCSMVLCSLQDFFGQREGLVDQRVKLVGLR